jgi:hypothetical protein
MRATMGFLAACLLAPMITSAQAHDETSRAVKDGGVFVAGWTGEVDPKEAQGGRTLKDARLADEGGALHVTTGPAVTYWKPSNVAKGDYTVKATFKEAKFMALNDHPHPYGLVVGGSGLGSPDHRYLYCAAYGNGSFIVRGFGPEPFQLNGRRAQANPAVHAASGPGEPVTQDVAISVKGGRVECAINGTVVAGYDKAELVAAGRLASTDGIYGLRFGHNTEATVTGLTVTTP